MSVTFYIAENYVKLDTLNKHDQELSLLKQLDSGTLVPQIISKIELAGPPLTKKLMRNHMAPINFSVTDSKTKISHVLPWQHSI